MEFWSGRFKDGKLGREGPKGRSSRRSRRSLGLNLERLESRLALSTVTWTGAEAATNGNWSDPNNWQGTVAPVAGDDLVFPTGLTGAALTSTNDLASGTTFGSFTVQGSGYAIGGNSLALTGTLDASHASGTATVSLPIDFGSSAGTVQVDTTGAILVLSGVMSGSDGLTKQGAGTLTLGGSNLYTGTTTINGGTLSISADNNLGATPASATPGSLTISGGTLATTASFTLNPNRGIALGDSGGTISVASGTTLTYNGIAAGTAGGLTKAGSGTLVLSGTNTYAGTTIVAAGVLRVTGTVGPVSVNAGATLSGAGTVGAITTTGATLSPDTPITAIVTLTDTGNLTLDSTSTYQVALNGASAYNQTQVAGTVTLGGAALSPTLGFTPTGRSQFTIINNTGSAPVTGTFANLAEGAVVTVSSQRFKISYVGGDGNDVVLTRVLTETWTGADAATNKNWSDPNNWQGSVAPIAGDDLVFPTGLTGAALTSTNDLVSGTTFGSFTVQGSGYAIGGNSLALTGTLDASHTSGTATVSLPIDFGSSAGTVRVDTSGAILVLGGAIAGQNGLAKQGAGELDLTTTNTYAGTTTVAAGLLRVTGTVGPVSISSGATLGGTGTVSSITATGGTLNPGTPTTAIVTLTDAGSLTLNSTSTYQVALNGASAYSRTQVGGAINLGGAVLSPTLGFTPTGNETFTILNNTGVGAVTGTFANLAEGAIVTVSNQQFQISYAGGDGNDVVLTHVFSTNTTLTASETSPTYGQPVTLTAAVTTSGSSSTPAGTVVFKDGTSEIGTAPLDSTGKATLTLSTLTAITHALTAVYSGNPSFGPSTSSALSLTIEQGSVTTTLSSSLNPSSFGQEVTLTARVAPVSPAVTTPTGTVVFQIGTAVLAPVPLTNGVATLTTSNLPVGSDSLTAVYSGDVNYAAGTAGALGQQVTAGAATISLTASNLTPFPIDTVTLTASVAVPTGAAVATGSVTFLGPNGLNLGSTTLNNGVATLAVSSLPVGNLPVTAVYSGDSNYSSVTSQPLALVVGSANQRYIDEVFQSAFGHSAGIGRGIDYWTALLNLGYSRKVIVNQIVRAPSAKNEVVQEIYQSFVGRAARPAEVKQARNGSVAQAEAQALGSRDYYVNQGEGTIKGFLTALAQDLTGAPFPANLQARYAREIKQGTSRSQLALQVINSPRGIRGQIEKAYNRTLGTPADPQGLAQFTRLLKSGGQITQVIDALLVSDAFYQKATTT